MKDDSLELFERIKRLQPAVRWASIIFFLTTISVMLVELHPKIEYAPLEPLWVLLLLWGISQTLTLLPLVFLIVGPGMNAIHVAVRLKVLFEYLVSAWLTFSAFWFRYEDMHGNLIGREPTLVLIGTSGLILVAARWYLQK